MIELSHQTGSANRTAPDIFAQGEYPVVHVHNGGTDLPDCASLALLQAQVVLNSVAIRLYSNLIHLSSMSTTRHYRPFAVTGPCPYRNITKTSKQARQ